MLEAHLVRRDSTERSVPRLGARVDDCRLDSKEGGNEGSKAIRETDKSLQTTAVLRDGHRVSALCSRDKPERTPAFRATCNYSATAALGDASSSELYGTTAAADQVQRRASVS
jgi:hypothetical protein